MKPKVCILIDSTQINGPARGLLQFLKHRPTEAFDFLLCTFRYRRTGSREFITEVERRGWPLFQLTERFRWDPTLPRQFCRLLQAQRCNLMQTHGYKGHVLACLAARRLGLPWIAFSHGFTQEDLKVRCYNMIERFLFRYPDLCIAVSAEMQKLMHRQRRGGQSVELLPNAVDPDELAGAKGGAAFRTELGVAADQPLIGCIGRFSHEKGQALLIAALAQLLPAWPQARLLLVGSGLEEPRLRAQVERLGLNRAVLFSGRLTAIRDCYEALDILALPSLSEGLPNVLLEAAALGVPVVTTNVGAIPQIFPPQTAGLVPPASAEHLSAALAEALQDLPAAKSRAAAARAAILTRFDPAARAQRLAAIYQRFCR